MGLVTITFVNVFSNVYFYVTSMFLCTEKVQAELDSIIGSSRQPSISDRDSTPYTYAVVQETQRMGNILPLNIVRMANRDTPIGKYTIPKVETHSKVILSLTNQTLFWKGPIWSPYFCNFSHRAPCWWPPWTLSFVMRLCGKRPTPSTLNTSLTKTARLGRGRPSCPFQLVCIHATLRTLWWFAWFIWCETNLVKVHMS